MTTVTTPTRISQTEFNALCMRAKEVFGDFKFSMRYHGKSGAKYAYGSFDIRPTKANDGLFTESQVTRIIAWLRANNFYVKSYEHEIYVYQQGFYYIYKAGS